jgi:hypothetical protein
MHASTTRYGPVLVLAALVAPAPPLAAAVALPGGRSIEKVDFERHVMGLFGRMGCNSGSCHGSFQGKGGLQLSLFGYDPAKDYASVVRASSGRRVNLTDPDRSLLLLKATGQAPHGGLTRFGKASWPYRVLRAWVADGARWSPGSGTVRALRVSPPEYAFAKAGQQGRLMVQATFANGEVEDVTSLCDFRTNDEAVVEVTRLGAVKSLRPGDTAVIVSYRGTVTPVRVLVPANLPPGFVYPKTPENNFIDRAVFAKLRRLNMAPSALSSDGEFLRRVTLDVTGSLPTAQQVRAFLADRRPDKRGRKVDELLADPLHAALWATKFCDITGNNTDGLEAPQQRRPHLSQMWHDWFRKRVAANMPYDQIVKNVLTATSREGRSPEDYLKEVEGYEEAQEKNQKTTYADRQTLDLFWRKQQRVAIDQWGEKTAAAFLGVRLECAQCHKHPFDRWTQADYRAYANLFAPVAFAASPEAAKLYRTVSQERQKKARERQQKGKGKGKTQALPLGPVREVYVAKNKQRTLPDPDTGRPLPPRALGGPVIDVPPGDDPRAALFEWMAAADNPFFARSFVNRVWGHYFGVGIVHPVDDFSLANPPSNAKLLDALAAYFVANRFDLRKLERAILLSRTYQLSSIPNATNRHDRNNFARSYVRPMMAEVVVDALNTALGVSERWQPSEAPDGARAIEVGASRVQNQNVNYVLRVFGRPPRTTACDCERAMEPALPQKLFLLADPNVQQKLRQGQNRLAALLKLDDEQALEELFLSTLARKPTTKERLAFLAYRDSKTPDASKGAAKLLADTLWALINTKEFIFNH